jgi:hypothetical protein
MQRGHAGVEAGELFIEVGNNSKLLAEGRNRKRYLGLGA